MEYALPRSGHGRLWVLLVMTTLLFPSPRLPRFCAVRGCAGVPPEYVPPAKERGQRLALPWGSERGPPQKVSATNFPQVYISR